jgi:hypothetical protein
MTITFGRISLDVRGSDIDNVTIVMRRGIDIDGRLAIDGKNPTAAVPVSLQPIENGAVLAGLSAGRFQSQAGTDGNFKILAVPESLFRVQMGVSSLAPGVRGAAPSAMPAGSPVLPSGAYVVDIRQSGESIYDSGLRVGSAQMAPVEIFVKTDAGKIQGIVHDNRGQRSNMPLSPSCRRRIAAEIRICTRRRLPMITEVSNSTRSRQAHTGCSPGQTFLRAVPIKTPSSCASLRIRAFWFR